MTPRDDAPDEQVDGRPAVVAVYHRGDGVFMGAALIRSSEGLRVAKRTCVGPFNRCHVFFLAHQDQGDGRRCQCGQFVRRVFVVCPTCHHPNYVMAERVEEVAP